MICVRDGEGRGERERDEKCAPKITSPHLDVEEMHSSDISIYGHGAGETF